MMSDEDDVFWAAWLDAPTGKPFFPDLFKQTYTPNSSNGLWLYVGPNAIARAGKAARIMRNANVPDCSRVIAAIDPKQINPNAYKWEICDMEVLILAEKEVPDIQISRTAEILLENAASVVRACRDGGTIQVFKLNKEVTANQP